MSSSPGPRAAGFAAPMLIGLLAAQRGAEHVRTVDFIFLFFGGLAFGVGLGQLIAFYRARRAAAS